MKIAIPVVGLVFIVAIIAVVGFVIPRSLSAVRDGPEQPIPYPHDFHVQTLGLECQFCHRTVDDSPQAGIPAIEQCMFCHALAGSQNENALLVRNAFYDGEAVNWMRVHRLPDHVGFVHESHVRYFTQQGNTLPSGEQATVPSQVCSTCHGDVGSMSKVSQVRHLTMGDCMSCHREYNGPADCMECHK